MKKFKALMVGGAVTAALTAGLWSATATTASADVVCNQWNECWHVRNHYDYPTGLGIVFHPNGWHGRHMHWRHDRWDHGYYRNGVWIRF
jgi:hypothetical protein